MNLRQRLIESTNHVQEDVGDHPTIVRATYEDALVQALEDTLLDGRLDAFRTHVRRWARELGWPEDVYRMLMHQETYCWLTVHWLICTVRRMMPRYEYSANILLRWGITPPQGQDELRQ